MTAGRLTPVAAHRGLFAHLVRSVRPDVAAAIRETGRIETAVIGLGGQGTRHAALMRDYGTLVVGGVAPGRAGERIAETIPVFDSVEDLVAAHPHLAAVSIWRHFSSAREGAIEAIHAGVPVVVLISEGIPLRDVRDVIAAARARGTLLIGGNTPGVIFPPERIKVGMLPDVFHPAEPRPGRAGPAGVTILSRSGAILYHLSDALASSGVAQNGVLGVGGDGAIGSTFRDLVPRVMTHRGTEMVVVAGEIGGAQEEAFAEDLAANPGRYPKPIVALLSGRRAPAGKTMGHAGAVVSPGERYGTFESKRDALAAAGVTVVNSQYDLIDAVRKALGGKTYFDTGRYYERMKETWEAPPPKPSWGTRITMVEPNRLVVAGFELPDLIREADLIEAAILLGTGERPDRKRAASARRYAKKLLAWPAPKVRIRKGEQASAALARMILLDDALASPDAAHPVAAAVRTLRFLSRLLGTESDLDGAPANSPFEDLVARAIGGRELSRARRGLVTALAVASIDHGVTPPSAQATILAASVRAPFPVALASGVGAITDVHGGAGEEAAGFFRAAIARADAEGISPEEAAAATLADAAREGRRIAGLGHRVHTEDPRRDVLWDLAAAAGAAGPAVALSKRMEDLFAHARGFRLPINVDGVIGAIVADLGLAPVTAKALFVLGRTAGLAAHYLEEIATQPPMRRIRFDEAVYRGPPA